MRSGVQDGTLVTAHKAKLPGIEQACQGLATLGADNMAVPVCLNHGIHDLLLCHLDYLEGIGTANLNKALCQLAHPGEGHGVADHGSLGNAGTHGHRLPDPCCGRSMVIAVDGIGMLALHAEDTRQGGDDAKLVHLQKAVHDGSDVAGIAHRHKDARVCHVPAVPLRRLIGKGLLAQDAPGIL